MTGPEHYREAERLLYVAARWEAEPLNPEQMQQIANTRAEAQVHATLALAAASALPAAVRYYGSESKADRAWSEVIGA